MNTIFHDRRSKSPLARRIFLSVWLAVATTYVIGIVITGTVLYVNLDMLMNSPPDVKLKFFLVAIGFAACVHGAMSLCYLFWKELPHMVAVIEEDNSDLKITSMNGDQNTYPKDNVSGIVEHAYNGFAWYSPYSLTIGGAKKCSKLQVLTGDEYFFSHDAELKDLQRSLA